jgi:hypothetical protein
MFHHPPLSTSGFKDIGLGMGGGFGNLAIGSSPTAIMPNGFLIRRQPDGWTGVQGRLEGIFGQSTAFD